MKKTIGQAPGKLILSGEYAVIFGYSGIAIPAPFRTTVSFEENPSSRTLTIENILKTTDDRPVRNILTHIERYTGPLRGTLRIESTIPIGRGMGSSTALVIALCRCLLTAPREACHPERSRGTDIKNTALSIEDTVNPGHSGLDFAVIWEGKPVKFTKADGPTPIDIDLPFLDNAVLIDTGKPEETTPEMVRWITERIGVPSPLRNNRPPHPNPLPWGEGIMALQTIAHCTERLLQGESAFTVFPHHHRAQVALGVVPTTVQDLIADIESTGGAAKVIGAGGRSSKGTKIPSDARSAEPREGAGMVLTLHSKPAEILAIAKKYGVSAEVLAKTTPPLHFPPLTTKA